MKAMRNIGSSTLAVFILWFAAASPGHSAITPTTLASGLNHPWGLVLDSSSVYWADQTAGTGNGNQSIKKVGVDGGSVTTLASGVDCPYSMAVDAVNVYWAECHTGDLRKVGKNEGAITTLYHTPPGTTLDSGIAADGTSVYFNGFEGSGRFIKKVGINGGAVTTLATGLQVISIAAVDGTSVYFVDSTNGAIKKVGINGGAVTTLVSGESITRVAIDATNLYWIAGNGVSIKKVGLNGGAVTTLVASGADGFNGIIAVDSTNVYWAGGGLYAIAKNGGSVTTVSSSSSGFICPGGLAVDAASIYWTENSCDGAGSYTGVVKKIALSAASPALCTYTFSDWGACQPNGTQDRTIILSSPAGCIDWVPTLTQACTYVPPACTYTYSAWGACQPNGTQSRTVTSSSPAGCTGTPVLSQSCTYAPPPAAPIITFTPASVAALATGQVFDFSIGIDFGQTLEVRGLSVAYQGIDITQFLIDAYVAGAVQADVLGNVMTITIPAISLPAGQHTVTVTAANPAGSTTASWNASVGSPGYTLSNDQRALITANGNPDYLTITFNAVNQRREETWVYGALQKMYLFWDGVRFQETNLDTGMNANSKPPRLDPTLFTKDTKLADLVRAFGNNYVSLDSLMDANAAGPSNYRGYYFRENGLIASYFSDVLSEVQTIDINGLPVQ